MTERIYAQKRKQRPERTYEPLPDPNDVDELLEAAEACLEALERELAINKELRGE